ncbi:MAG TPA: sigma-70 family RNA polymerase sigma factor [bacterium]|nr:sigma-70 family RNA polymerase sigma factor [bacterium]
MNRAALLESAPLLASVSVDAAAAQPATSAPPDEGAPVERPARALPGAYSVEQLLPLVQSIARMVGHALPPVVELDDLVHDGVVGLLECARRYDPSRGVDFRTYASYRIRGAILDGLRARDPLPRSVRRALKAADRQAAEGSAVGRARALGPPPAVTQLMSLDEAGSLPEDGAEPEQRILVEEFARTLRRAVADLALRDREVLHLRFTRGWRLREVAAHYGISITRVAEVQGRAIRRLRLALDIPRAADLSPNGRRKRRRGR